MTGRCAFGKHTVLTFYQNFSLFYVYQVVGQKKKFKDPFDEYLKNVSLLSVIRLNFRTLDIWHVCLEKAKLLPITSLLSKAEKFKSPLTVQ